MNPAGDKNSRTLEIPFQRRFKLWQIAFGLALLVTGIRSPILILYFWAFPLGLVHVLRGSGNSSESLLVSWIIYGVLSICLWVCRPKTIFLILYVLFCLLLAVNVAGCYQMQGDLRG